MTHTIAVIPGDGIGQEVIPAAQAVLESLHLPLIFHPAEAGFGTFEKHGMALPLETLALCEKSDAILFGATSSPMEIVDGYQSPILKLRRYFDLFANLRPTIGITIDDKDIDILIVRENTEGLYSGREYLQHDGKTAIAERVITEHASERIVRIACDYALQRRQRLIIVHKANVLKETCGLFRRVAFRVAAEYPSLTINELLIDTCAMRLVLAPNSFDVIVTTNLFGDILSDIAAGLNGGLGNSPSANIGDKRPAVFEPVHGSAPDIAGKGIADPRAAILSGAMALDFLGYPHAAAAIRKVTYNISHSGYTEKTTAAIIRHLEQEYIHVQ